MTRKPPISRHALAQASHEVIGYLHHKLGHEVGLTVFVFEFVEADYGNIAYISNAQRADMIEAVRVWLARMDAELVTDPPGPKAKG